MIFIPLWVKHDVWVKYTRISADSCYKRGFAFTIGKFDLQSRLIFNSGHRNIINDVVSLSASWSNSKRTLITHLNTTFIRNFIHVKCKKIQKNYFKGKPISAYTVILLVRSRYQTEKLSIHRDISISFNLFVRVCFCIRK